MSRARVCSVVLNYAHVEDTLACVASLRSSTHVAQTLIVVDSASTRSSREALESACPATRVLGSEENLGYAGGNNVGIRRALESGADWVWLVNPDAAVEPSTLERLLACAHRRPDVGILGSRILYGGGGTRRRIWFDGGRIDVDRCSTGHINDGRYEADVPPGAPREVDYITGAGMLVRRQVFEDVGLLPEDWFLYFEETEFNIRARQRGWGVVVEPTSVMVHHKRSTGALPAPYYVYYYARNRLAFFERYGQRSFDEILAVLEADWIGPWRTKVEKQDPTALTDFEHLIAAAVADARIGRLGRRQDLAALTEQHEGSVA